MIVGMIAVRAEKAILTLLRWGRHIPSGIMVETEAHDGTATDSMMAIGRV
jgi:hypothetical protein